MKQLEAPRGEIIGSIGVDSGQIMVIDPCYAWQDDFKPDSAEPTGAPYDATCRVTLAQRGFGPIAGLTAAPDAGFATATLYGDGQYPIFGEFVDGRLARITICFDDLNTEDDDDDQEDDDELDE